MNFALTNEPDFEAEITILTTEQGGRKRPPHNGIRWDFRYPEDDLSKGIHMICPYFLNKNGVHIPTELPIVDTVSAQMFIVVREMVPYHRERISVGAEFHCHEGSKKVATGKVTKLLALSSY